MLEHLPGWLGGMLRNFRAGHSKLAILQPELEVGDAVIDLSSPAFPYGGRLPVRFTADGEGVSPPLVWGDVPDGTAGLVLIVEDPDAPAIHPMVHALVPGIAAEERRLTEGAIVKDGGGGEGWVPPDPPTGHGTHDYVFQLFALDAIPDLGPNPGRSGAMKAMTGHVLGAGMLVGTYSRGENAIVGGSAVAGLSPA